MNYKIQFPQSASSPHLLFIDRYIDARPLTDVIFYVKEYQKDNIDIKITDSRGHEFKIMFLWIQFVVLPPIPTYEIM